MTTAYPPMPPIQASTSGQDYISTWRLAASEALYNAPMSTRISATRSWMILDPVESMRGFTTNNIHSLVAQNQRLIQRVFHTRIHLLLLGKFKLRTHTRYGYLTKSILENVHFPFFSEALINPRGSSPSSSALRSVNTNPVS